MVAATVRPALVRHFGGMRLDHQIADGEDQTVLVDHDAGTLALAPEALHGLPVGIDVGLDAHDRGDELFDRGRAGGKNKCRNDGQSQHEAAKANGAHGFSHEGARSEARRMLLRSPPADHSGATSAHRLVFCPALICLMCDVRRTR